MAAEPAYDPPYVGDREIYGAYDHDQLWNLVREALDPTALGEVAAAWHHQAEAIETAFDTFADTVRGEFEHWSGRARAVAEPMTAAFIAHGGSASEICALLHQVMEANAEAAQMIRDAMPEPRDYRPLPDAVAEVVHGGVRRMAHEIAAAADLADAHDIMTFRYNTTLAASGDRIPRFTAAPQPDSGGGRRL